ncbi:MAG TPA: hypothetical protein VFB63_29910 [Bryobacteraceae bacterium]|nr:hypothetical protein [Bryobacteraceae bacterium]
MQEADASPATRLMEHQQIEVTPYESETEAQAQLARKVREIIEDAETHEEPAQALSVRNERKAIVEHLRESHAGLALRAREAQAKIREATTRLDEIWIANPAKPKQVDQATKALEELEREHRSVTRAGLRIAERRLPKAEIELLFAEAEANFAMCLELREIANERFRRTAELMTEAAQHEGEILFDPSNTVSGQLQAQAMEYERRGNDNQRWADDRQVQFDRLMKELDPTA